MGLVQEPVRFIPLGVSDIASSPEMSTDDLKAEVDEKLGEMGLTLTDVAPVMKAQSDAEKDLWTDYEMANPDVLSFSFSPSSSCNNPIIDWNFGVGKIFLCINIGSNVVVDALIEVAGIRIWSYNVNLGLCGGTFRIPSIGIPPVGPKIEGTVEIRNCGNNRFVRVCLCARVPIFGCQSLGCQQVSL